MILPIHQELDPSKLLSLSEEALDVADEAGELDGNQHYVDLSTVDWADVAFALQAETKLIQQMLGCDDYAEALERLEEEQDVDDERAALWHLELGVAAPVLALNALGAHTALSCNGGAFGGQHLRDLPSIRFYPQSAGVEDLLALARDSEVGLVEEEGRALLYASDVQGLQRFAALALKRYGNL
jgi:hypothetical protein